MYYTQEQIDRANQADLVSFLQSQGEQLTRAGNEYRWKRHDSLTVRGNKWYRHSQSKGGGPVDFIMEFFGKSFTEAVELLTGEKGTAPPQDSPQFRLPPRSPDNRTARNYLTAARRIDEDVTGFFFASGDIYEDAAHHNAVFVGRDEDGIPRYAHSKGTAGNFLLDVKGSDKAFNFCYRGEGERLFVFEAPVDLLSFLCLFKKEWQKQSYLSLGGVGEKALLRFLSDRPNIKTVYLCLDSDQAGSDACSRLAELVPEGLTVHRLVPLYKDWNEVLQHRAEITDGKYIQEAVYGLKEPPQEETVEIIRMSEVDKMCIRDRNKLYEDNALGTIPQDRYEQMSQKYSEEYYTLKTELAGLQEQLSAYENAGGRAQKCLKLTERHAAFTDLTPAILNEFVSRIEVHERDKKRAKQAIQHISIYFNYIGRFENEVTQLAEPTEQEIRQMREEIEEAKKEKSRAYHRQYSREYRARNLEKRREYDRMKAREYRAKKKAQEAAAAPAQ